MVVRSVRAATPYPCTPKVLLQALVELVRPLPRFHRVSVGFPGVVREGKVITAPHFGNDIWCGCDLPKAFAARLGKPVRLLNDADMQGLAAIRGRGLELVVTLGTGVGTALFRHGQLMPHLELAHHPVYDGATYNQYIGDAVRKRIGNARWNRRVRRVMNTLQSLINYDAVYIGGGNARQITFTLDDNMRIISNKAGILGGIALWRTSRSG